MSNVKTILINIGVFLAGICLGAISFFGIKRNNTRIGGNQQTAGDVARTAGENNTRIEELERREASLIESAGYDNLSAQELNKRSGELIKKAKNVLDIN